MSALSWIPAEVLFDNATPDEFLHEPVDEDDIEPDSVEIAEYPVEPSKYSTCEADRKRNREWQTTERHKREAEREKWASAQRELEEARRERELGQNRRRRIELLEAAAKQIADDLAGRAHLAERRRQAAEKRLRLYEVMNRWCA